MEEFGRRLMLTSVPIFIKASDNDAQRATQIQIIVTLGIALVATKSYGHFDPYHSDSNRILSEIGQWSIVLSLGSLLYMSLRVEGESRVSQIVFFAANLFVLSYAIYITFNDIKAERALMLAISKRHLSNLKSFADMVKLIDVTELSGPSTVHRDEGDIEDEGRDTSNQQVVVTAPADVGTDLDRGFTTGQRVTLSLSSCLRRCALLVQCPKN